jgi:hypothetical protein
MATWNIFQTLEICYDHLVHVVFIWYIYQRFGKMYQKNLATLGSAGFRGGTFLRKGLVTRNNFSVPKVMHHQGDEKNDADDQGCQICLGAKYQNGENCTK